MKIRLSSRPAIAALALAGAGSVAAFLLAPAALLSGAGGAFPDEAALTDALGRGLVEYWQGGRPAYPALLASLVDYWFRWHAIKVLVSGLMLAVFALLATALWRRYVHGPARYATTAAGATVLPVLAAGLLILNIQATAVPLVALLPLADSAEFVREVRDGLTEPAGPPALARLLAEVARYHWVMAALAGVAMAATALAAAHLWRHRGTGPPRAARMRRSLAVILGLTAALLLAVAAVSLLSALDPPAALLGLLGEG
ncbi:hypothetical protein GCM10010172_34110 [Paractinoplanes ferrugineus]|uniref:Uncharacterized protein n=1 Tax=Paractinoplanes ferrugineus TaxID=113564 RepID=A0A919MGB7_9ACTN|nr:hypothetical protein [Actinoplanes ferrugineus]GIE14658.1 hypothetical protein Afe05nite_64980 [Actinoplanes ferrugineus]